jgi:hypothetical protein
MEAHGSSVVHESVTSDNDQQPCQAVTVQNSAVTTHSTASGPSVSYSGTLVMLKAWAAASRRTHSVGVHSEVWGGQSLRLVVVGDTGVRTAGLTTRF